MTKIMTIEGMMCHHCTGRVEKTLAAIEGVAAVEMSLEGKTATLTLDKAEVLRRNPDLGDEDNAEYCATSFLFARQVLNFEGYYLHSSAVIHEGGAILFTAPSGTGKSTQASLWETYAHAEIINGDKVIVSASDGVPVAYGGPIAGTSRIYKDAQAPIRAIVYLHQGAENQLTLLDRRHAFMALYSQAVKSGEDAAFNEALIPLIAKIVERVPVADYSCQPNASAVEYLQSRLNSIPSDKVK